MPDKPINPWLRQALELGPPLLFFIAYMRFQDTSLTIGGRDYDGFILVTAGFVPLLLVTIAILWKLTGRVSRLQVFTAVMVVVFGGLTIWLNDERFFKMKTTLVYGFFAVTLGFGLLRGQGCPACGFLFAVCLVCGDGIRLPRVPGIRRLLCSRRLRSVGRCVRPSSD